MELRRPLSVATAVSALLLCTLAACGADGRAGKRGRHGDTTETSNGTVDIPRVEYRVASGSATGSVTGHVLVAGEIPTGGSAESDSSLAAASTAATDCRTRPGAAIVHTGNALGDVVVWIAGAQSGKPLPTERRLEVTQVGCEFEPRVQVAVTGSTINVRNADKGVHWIATHFVGATDTLSLDRFNDDGQVVPDDRLAKRPGMVELQCRQHPSTRAYVAVFDHPYATVTAKDGSFRIDSLPPGHYKLMAWHERSAQPVSQEIDVVAGKAATAEVKIGLK